MVESSRDEQMIMPTAKLPTGGNEDLLKQQAVTPCSFDELTDPMTDASSVETKNLDSFI